ncbi:unnamed protein product [Jaminaea pallidilutea]
MSALEEFAKAFRDAVSRAKLSSSRVEAVKQAATKCFDRAQLAKAEVLQIHHGASDSAASICSLYLFDAASRHAKDVVRKNGAGLDPVKVLPSTKQAGDPKAALISAAKEFLSEMSTIVMEVTEETARMASTEQKEKVLKVIDIWRKANTFDGSLLDTVSERIKSTRSSNAGESSKGHPRSTTPVGVPPPDHGVRMASAHGGSGTAGSSSLSSARAVATPPPPPVSGPGPPGLPANLAALLGANGSQEQQNSGSNGQQQAPSNTESFMASLSSLLGQGGARNDGSAQQTRHSDTAAPQFDLSQLTPLQQQYANPQQQQQQQQQQPPQQQQQQIQQAALSHFPPGGLAQPTKPPQPAEASGASTWPPAQNPSAGDLSDFDPFSFDPTRPENWTPLAQRWANTYGYMPSLSELGLNFLMFFQTAMMQQQQQQQGGMGGGGSSM